MEKIIKEEKRNLQLFNLVASSDKSLAVSFIKNGLFFVFALGIFAVTLYADNIAYLQNNISVDENAFLRPANETASVSANGQSLLITSNYDININDIISTGESGNIEIMLSGSGVVRLDKNTEIQFTNIDNDNKAYIIKLIKGGIWANTLYDNYNIKIQTDYAYIKPENAAFSVVYDGNATKIFSSNHDVYVGILYNNEEINSFWLPDGNSVSVPNSKITEKYETIKKLLYSKLIKEFNYGRLSKDAINKDPWISLQTQKDEKYRDDVKNLYFAGIRETGLKAISTSSIRYQFKSLVSDLENILTISDQKKTVRLLDLLFENLHDAQFLYLQGNNIDAQLRLAIFKEDISSAENTSNEIFKKDLFVRLNNELKNGIFINPTDSMYPIKSEIENQLFSVNLAKYLDDAQRFKLLTLKLYDSNDSATLDPETSSKILLDYLTLYKQIIKGYKDKMEQISVYIERQNILMDNILSKYPQLYKVEIFENKAMMEQNYIDSISGGNEKKEQRQTFISNKIDLLSRIKYFLFDDLINVEDARQIVFLLIEDIEKLKKDTLDLAAVNTLFEKRLSDFGVFWQYLNSPEYSTTPLHGKTHAERFEAFKDIQQQYVSFQDVRDEILGQEEVVVSAKPTVESILADAEKDLNAAGIQNVDFGYYNDVSQTKIPILKAVTNGITFRGTYDFEKKLIANIIVNDKILSADGVKLANAKMFITQALSEASNVIQGPITQEPPKQEDSQSALKNAARVFVVEKFAKAGITIDKSNVEIVDFDAGEYSIKNVYYTEKKQATFSFSYLTKEDKVFNLKVNTAAGVKEVTDTFVSAFLKPVVLKIYDEA